MTKSQLLRLLEETLHLGQSTLTGSERLDELPNWDSMSTLLFIAMASFGMRQSAVSASLFRSQR